MRLSKWSIYGFNAVGFMAAVIVCDFHVNVTRLFGFLGGLVVYECYRFVWDSYGKARKKRTQPKIEELRCGCCGRVGVYLVYDECVDCRH